MLSWSHPTLNMRLKRIVSLTSLISSVLTVSLFAFVYFQNNISSTLVQFGLFFLFTSALGFGNLALWEFNSSASGQLKKILTVINFSLVFFAGLISFNIIPFGSTWHILTGLGIIYLLTVQLQLLGWSYERQSLLNKIVLALVLLSNLFLAALFIFRLDYYQLRPLIILSVLIAILAIFYGLYFSSNKTIEADNQKV